MRRQKEIEYSIVKKNRAMNVLIVEDDPGVVRFWKQAVSEAGYAVQAETNGLAALQSAQRTRELHAQVILAPLVHRFSG